MKLIIDITKEDFEIMKHNIAVDNPLCPIDEKEMVTKVANGIPLDKIITGLEAHKWNKDEGSKAIYNSAINDAITYIEEYKAESGE